MRFLEDINVRQEIIDIYKNSFLYEIIMDHKYSDSASEIRFYS